VIDVPKQRWTPDTANDEQKQLVEAAVATTRQADQWSRAAWASIAAAQAGGVPLEYLAQLTGRSPASFYRHAAEAKPSGPTLEPPIVAELDVAAANRVREILREERWTAREFLLAALTALAKDPKPLLARLAEFRPPRRRSARSSRPSGSGKSSNQA
jgi:hypothetical protein